MGAILALILPLVPSIVNGVEALFAKKPASGTDKMSAALQAIRAIVTQFLAAKVPMPDGSAPPVGAPTDDALTGMIETVLAQMKTTGTLSATPAATTQAGAIFLVQGTVTPLKTA